MSKYNHLFHLENTEENRELISTLNKNMKDKQSIHRFTVRYRKPLPGHKYGWGGSLKRENAGEFAVYLKGAGVANEERKQYLDEIRSLHRKNWELLNHINRLGVSLKNRFGDLITNSLRNLSSEAFKIIERD